MKVFEMFSGIGGTHAAVLESPCNLTVERALDINTTANHVYKHNFPGTSLMQNNVQSLQPSLFDELGIEMLTMSPPCQPYTRQGHQKGADDTRNDALSHILSILPDMKLLKFIFLENVVGFEASSTREQLLSVLGKSGFRYQEFILSPTQLGIPNSRHRYYLLAKKGDFCFEPSTETGIMKTLPRVDNTAITALTNKFAIKKLSVGDVIAREPPGERLSDKVLTKYATILDIVQATSFNSCCFTKGYTHYTEGTGSVFCPSSKEKIDDVYKRIQDLDQNDPKYLDELRSLDMRYFSPAEVLRLMSFPGSFSFPNDVTDRQKYRLLGNSVNVHVVAVLIKLLVT